MACPIGDLSGQVQAKVAVDQAQKNAQLQELLAQVDLAGTDEAKRKAAIQKIRDTFKTS